MKITIRNKMQIAIIKIILNILNIDIMMIISLKNQTTKDIIMTKTIRNITILMMIITNQIIDLIIPKNLIKNISMNKEIINKGKEAKVKEDNQDHIVMMKIVTLIENREITIK